MKRLGELDALRGIAACIVVLDHFSLVWMNDRHFTGGYRVINFVLSPLYAGHEAVMLFFLLSGFVLSLPFEAGRPQPYRVYAIRRVTRIYGPYLVALCLALTGAYFLHGRLQDVPGLANQWSQPPSRRLILDHVAFLGEYDTSQFNTVIWSLIHEMRISILFPFLWLLTKKIGNTYSFVLAGGLSLLSILLEHGTVVTLSSWRTTPHYAAFFVIGILLARNYVRLVQPVRLVAPLLAIASFLLFFKGAKPVATLMANSADPNTMAIAEEWVVLAGAAGFVLLAISTRSALTSRVPLFLGRISYSLYLIHVPILMVLTYVGGEMVPALQFPIYMALCLALSTLFCFYIEEPITQWGRRITGGGKQVERAVEPERPAYIAAASDV
jgi:peptidoglycan/LPS O-acetylase OafA/YrhL